MIWASAIGFKISFTAADAPEILTELVRLPLKILDQVPLTTQAQTVFLGLAGLGVVIVLQNRTLPKRTRNPYRKFLVDFMKQS